MDEFIEGIKLVLIKDALLVTFYYFIQKNAFLYKQAVKVSPIAGDTVFAITLLHIHYFG